MGTLRAWKWKIQISRAQSRTKSGAPAVTEDSVEWKEIESAGLAGSAQINALETGSEGWFWLPVCDGSAGLDCGSGVDFALQHGISAPCWQQARTCLAHGVGVSASRNGVPASTRLQMMAHVVFTFLMSRTRRRTAKHILASVRQFLFPLALALASASLMIFMYLSGSPRKVGWHIGQQNLISWLMPLVW